MVPKSCGSNTGSAYAWLSFKPPPPSRATPLVGMSRGLFFAVNISTYLIYCRKHLTPLPKGTSPRWTGTGMFLLTTWYLRRLGNSHKVMWMKRRSGIRLNPQEHGGLSIQIDSIFRYCLVRHLAHNFGGKLRNRHIFVNRR